MTLFECTVAGVINDGKGKFPKTDFEYQVIMPYSRNYIQTMFNATDYFQSSSAQIEPGFRDWILGTPDL